MRRRSTPDSSMEITRREALARGGVTLLGAGALAQAPPPQLTFREPAGIKELASRLLRESRVPGLVVAVLSDSRVSWVGGFGYADVASRRPMSPQTLFQAASLTKPLFAYAVMNLCEQGRLSLDAPIAEYVRNGKFAFRDSRADMISVRTVLSHTSGLPPFQKPGGVTLNAPPGRAFTYSGLGYDYLQSAVEAVVGMPLDVYMHQSVLAPLGMNTSSMTWREGFEGAVATGYDWDGTPVKETSHPDKASAAGSLHTTAGDYARFLLEMMSASAGDAWRPGYVYKRMALSPHACLREGLAWGLGWGLHLAPEGDRFWHFGDSRGYMTYAIATPHQRSGVVIFTNGRHGLRVADKLAESFTDSQDARQAHRAIFSWVYDVFYEGKLREWSTQEPQRTRTRSRRRT